MDFELGGDITDLRDLCAEIITDHSTSDRLGELDREGVWFDARTHRLLAEAGVLGTALPEAVGGAGVGLVGLQQILELVGQHVAQVPVWESVVVGALTLARHGSGEQQKALIPGVIDGSLLLTGALVEPDGADRHHPRTVAAAGGTARSWLLTGRKTQVPLAADARRILVPATTTDGAVGVFLVDPAAAGVRIEDQRSVSRRSLGLVTLTDAPGELVGELDRVLDDLLLHAEAGLAAMQVGNCEAALRAAAVYTSDREQFGQPIGTFQAVRQRLADGFIDVEAMRLTVLQAWSALEEEQPAEVVERAVAIAKHWAADGGHRVVYSAQHVHGGIGIDLDYGLHRHFRLGKHIELTLGGAGSHLRTMGRRFAEPPSESRRSPR